jgi:hypothetical protein
MTRRASQEANAAALPLAGNVRVRSPFSIPPIDPADVLGAARSFADISRIVADYCEQIGMSRATLDAEAFIGSGHAAKALAKRTRKKLGWVTMGRVLEAAGLLFYVARDPAAQIPASSVASRNGNRRDHHWRNVKGSAWGKRMAALRALKLTGPRRTEIARHAAQVRHRHAGNGTSATPQPCPQATTTTAASPLDTATNKPAPVPSPDRHGPRQFSMFELDHGSG